MDVAPLAISHSKGSQVVHGCGWRSIAARIIYTEGGARTVSFADAHNVVGCLDEFSGARQSLCGGECSIDDDSEQLEPVLE